MKTKNTKEKISQQSESQKPITNIRSIFDFFGTNKNKYQGLGKNLEEYSNYLKNLTDYQLELHARDFQIAFTSYAFDREDVTKKLLKLYQKNDTIKNEPARQINQDVPPDLNKQLTELMGLKS